MSSSLLLLLLSLNIYLVFLSHAAHQTAPKGVDPENPVLDVTPSPLYGKFSGLGSKDILYCERVRVSGHSRLKLQSYANSFRVTLSPSLVIPERLHGRIQICFHTNASLNLCHCGMDEWKTVQKGLWNSVLSPFDERYLDVKFIGEIHGSVTVAMAEDQQLWRLLCLAVGFVILLFAPIVSRWVPFYYSTSMAIGIFLVILIILFQGMKLLPTGRKNIFYLSVYGSVLGAGTFVLHHVSVLVNSILVNFGLRDEMHNPVYVFVLVGIVLAGAALGYWIVRKFVIEKDGTVDVGIAEFVKWAMRIIATTFILQSTLDIPLAIVVWALTYLICFHINKWLYYVSAKSSPGGKMWNSPKSPSSWSTPVKGYISQTMKLGALGVPAYRTFSVDELEEATNNFDTSTFMGEGSQGQIYRGQLKNGSFVAIRCLKMKRNHSMQNFMHHIELISKPRHRHLVSSLGHCFECYLDDSSVSRVFLIFEFVPNGTLRSWVSDGSTGAKLNWSQSISAAIGVAKGIQFLHTGIVPVVYANNMKITDILLDQNLVAKISSYNLPLLAESRENIGHGSASNGSKDINMKARSNQEKNDIYDFGMILLEIIVGRLLKSANELDDLKHQLQGSISGHITGLRSVIDPDVYRSCSKQSLKTTMEICIRCLHQEPEDRPSVEDILWDLQFAAQVQDSWRGDS